MKNSHFIYFAVFLLTSNISCSQQHINNTEPSSGLTANIQNQLDTMEKIVKTPEEWKAELTDFEYNVLREKGTERAFSGDYVNLKDDGIYHCKACDLPLFSSETKFKSGTGWPSYYTPIAEGHVKEIVDKRYGMVRTEVVCGRCDGHLGHVFNDGPQPTGLRYCINSVSLDFKKE